MKKIFKVDIFLVYLGKYVSNRKTNVIFVISDLENPQKVVSQKIKEFQQNRENSRQNSKIVKDDVFIIAGRSFIRASDVMREVLLN